MTNTAVTRQCEYNNGRRCPKNATHTLGGVFSCNGHRVATANKYPAGIRIELPR